MPQNQTKSRNTLQEIIDLIDSIDEIKEIKRPSGRPTSSGIAWLSRSSGKPYTEIRYPRLAVFIGNHAFAKAFPASGPTESYVNNYISDCSSGTHTLNKLANHANCDLRLYELTPPRQTANDDILKSKSPSQTEEDLCRALAYGMISVEPEIDLFTTCAIGAGTDAAAKAIIIAHHDETENSPTEDIQISALLSLNKGAKGLECLKTIGGPEISAICGAILAARLGRIPVLVEGLSGYAALLILRHHCPHIVGHCAITGRFDEKFSPLEEGMTRLPAPFETATEAGASLACMIALLRNEVALDGTNPYSKQTG